MTHKISELGKALNNECLHCPFNGDIHPDIINYCLHECAYSQRQYFEEDTNNE